jgi:hypothetical protein
LRRHRRSRHVSRRARTLPIAWSLVLVASTVTIALSPPTGAQSSAIPVNSTADLADANLTDTTCEATVGVGDCTLRAAMQNANKAADQNTITLGTNATYTLTTTANDAFAPDAGVGDLDITQPLIIEGAGATVRQADAVPERVFQLHASATIRDLEVTDGQATLSGGGIHVATGTLTLERSTVHGNTAAGIHLNSTTTATITASTISGNTGGGIRSNGTVTIDRSTIAGNSFGAGIRADAGTVTVGTTILSNGSNCSAAGGTITSAGYNLDTGTGCGFAQTGDRNGVAAKVLAVSDNGGPTPTQALVDTSVAVDAIPFGQADCTSALDDQLTNPRPHEPGLACDIGASELRPPIYADATNDTVDAAPGDGECADAAGDCTLRAAVLEANALTTADVVHLRPSGVYALTIPGADADGFLGDVDIKDNMILEGHGAVIDASAITDRAIEVRREGGAPVVTVREVEITGGNAAGSSGGGIAASSGSPTLFLERSTVRNNSAANGGGVFFSSTAAGSITYSTITGNSATSGGGVRSHAPSVDIRWSTITQNSASSIGGGLLATVGSPATAQVSLGGTIIANQSSGANCAQTSGGLITSAGYNLASDTSCNLSSTGDLPSTNPLLNAIADNGGPTPTHLPQATSPAIDGGPAFNIFGICNSIVDQIGNQKPEAPTGDCDMGAVEATEPVAGRKAWALWLHRFLPDPPVTVIYNPDAYVARAFAAYNTGDGAAGDADIATLATTDVDGAGDGADYYPDLDGLSVGWEGEFTSPLFFRMFVSLPAARAAMGDTAEDTVEAMIHAYVTDPTTSQATDQTCDFDWEWGGGAGNPWHDTGTENHELIRRTNCLLGLFALQEDTDPSNDPPASAGTWMQWANMLGEWLDQHAQSGLLDEVHSPGYTEFSLMALYNLVDLPTAGLVAAEVDVVEELGVTASAFLDVFWHDLALNFNPKTGVAGVAGARTYQGDPDGDEPRPNERGNNYAHPLTGFAPLWTYLYGWHDFAAKPANASGPQLLAAASSAYVPLDISRQVALDSTQAYEYTSMRPLREGATSDQYHEIRRDISGNPDYILGATTYRPGDEHHTPEAFWFGAAINNDPNDRIMISGIGVEKPGADGAFADFWALNGTAFRDVIIGARDHDAGDAPTPTTCLPPDGSWEGPQDMWDNSTCDGNSRGIRIFLGRGGLRENLELPTASGGWFFTRTGNAYAAIRIPSDVTLIDTDGQVFDPNDPTDRVMEIRLDNDYGDDIWTPFVVQMGRAQSFTSFQQFKDRVSACTFAYNPTTREIAYTSLRGSTFRMRAQETTASLPQISPDTDPTCVQTLATSNRNTHPSSSFVATVSGGAEVGRQLIAMTWLATTATLRGPTGTTSVTADLDYSP